MPVTHHLGRVVATANSESLTLGYHNTTKVIKFYPDGTSGVTPYTCYIQANQNQCVKGDLYPLCDENGKVFYYDNNVLNFQSGKVVVVKYTDKWEMGYL